MSGQPHASRCPELYLPHLGWLLHPPGDAVAQYLNEGWFEYREQAFLWLYLREGDTVLDCGSHFGLYAALAAHLMGHGTVLAVEPHPKTVHILRRNLEAYGTADVRVIPKAVSAISGEGSFYAEREGRAAYSSLIPETETEAVPVPITTLDELLAGQALPRVVDFAKIDVEGAEIDVLRGAASSIRQERLPLVMIECTEANLQRAGKSSRDLFDAAQSAGYQVLRFDAETLQFVPRLHDGPIWYENLFLARHADAVNQRLASASPDHLRIALEILQRGAAAAGLYQRLEESRQKIAKAIADAEQARADTAKATADAAQAHRNLEESGRLLGELARNLQPYLVSRYVRLGWQLRLIHKPVWLLRFIKRADRP
jgi:FkbM family methyltransferase